MKRLLLCGAVLLLLAASPVAAQSRMFDRIVDLPPGGTLRLDSSRGSVKLTAWDRSQVEIHARIELDDSWDAGYAKRAVDATTIAVGAYSNEVTVRGDYSNIPNYLWFFGELRSRPAIHYEIRAPRRVALRLNVDRSNSLISGFEGDMVLESDRSRIDAADLTGAMRVSIDRGGDSSFRNIRGSLTVAADRTNLRIDLARLEASSRIEIDRGDVDMSFARSQGFDLDTSLTRRTRIDTDFPIAARNSRRDRLSGAVNGGGPRLAIQADRGRVRLR
jgi:hypothetical protein